MKPLIVCLLSVFLFTSPNTFAGQKGTYYDYGRVVKVKPVFSRGHDAHSNRKCFQKSHGHQGSFQHSNYRGGNNGQNNSKVLPTVAGAVLGGVIGNRLTRNSHNQKLATVTGAFIGGVVGHEIAENSHKQNTPKYHAHKRQHHDEQCVRVQEYGHNNSPKGSKKLKGYRVTYRYKGEKFTTFTRKHPGGRIKLEISVRPAFYK